MNVMWLGMAAVVVAAVAALVVAALVARRLATALKGPAASRTIGDAVEGVHDSLDGFIVRSVDVIGAALAGAVPAPVQVMACIGATPAGASAPTPTLAGAAAAVSTATAALASTREALLAAVG